MEYIIYFDSKMKNRQIINAAFDCQVKPSDLASTIYPNWYAIRVSGGVAVMNKNHFKA
tara:strand:- start:480 stop:653 length:174 start_codon:yes stop_codon:yes gene_type:complete